MSDNPIDYKAACRHLGRALAHLSVVMQAAVIAEKQGRRGMTLIEDDLCESLMYPGDPQTDSEWDGTETPEDFMLRMMSDQ